MSRTISFRKMSCEYALFLLVLPLLSTSAFNADVYKRLLSIPMSAYHGKLWMACTSQPIEANQFVVGFTSISTKSVDHHMSIHVCDEPFSKEAVWDCSETTRVCGSKGRQALFECPRYAPGWTLPEDVGIPTGNKPRHLVLQVHMTDGFKFSPELKYDVSGIEVSLQSKKPALEVALAVGGNTGHIPADVIGYTTDSACVWNHNLTVPILAYSIHTHNLGTAVAALIYRDGQWLEIGRGDPAYPQFQMDVAHKGMTLQQGDVLAVRCTYNNPETHKVNLGEGNEDEMCNVYLHYGVPHEAGPDVRVMMCSANAQTFRLENYFDNVPDNLSDPTGDTDQAYYINKFHLTKVKY